MTGELLIDLDGATVGVHCGHERTHAFCQTLLGHFARPGTTSDTSGADLTIQLELMHRLPPLPDGPAYFVDDGHLAEEARSNLSAFHRSPGSIEVRFHDGAIVRLADMYPTHATVLVTPNVFRGGRIEDVLMTALAALLRTRGIYVVHAFAAEKAGLAVLLVGESGSGKTTTGLNLMSDGWRYLANDTALLRLSPQGVVALPSPGGFSILPKTLSLLPHLGLLSDHFPVDAMDGKHHVPARHIVPAWADRAPIGQILFPTVAGGAATAFEPLRPAVALARIMMESVDRWDQASIPDHVSVLQQLCRQAPSATMLLGEDLDRLPARLEALLAASPATARIHDKR